MVNIRNSNKATWLGLGKKCGLGLNDYVCQLSYITFSYAGIVHTDH